MLCHLWPLWLSYHDLRRVTRMATYSVTLSQSATCDACRFAKPSYSFVFSPSWSTDEPSWGLDKSRFGVYLCVTCSQRAVADIGPQFIPTKLQHRPPWSVDSPAFGLRLALLAKRSLLQLEAAHLPSLHPPGAPLSICSACLTKPSGGLTLDPTWGCTKTLEEFACVADSASWHPYCASCLLALTSHFRENLWRREAALLVPSAMQCALLPLPHDIVRLIWGQMGRLIDLTEAIGRDLIAADAA